MIAYDHHCLDENGFVREWRIYRVGGPLLATTDWENAARELCGLSSVPDGWDKYPGRKAKYEGSFIVERRYGRDSLDYLTAWDVIWGPIWQMNSKLARRYKSPLEAMEAMSDAWDICRAVPWRVPQISYSSTTLSVRQL